MFLSASYNYFNGEEHFLASLRSVRSEIDHISVVWQNKSNSGEMITKRAANTLEEAKALHLVDEVIHFEPDLKLKRRANESEKRKIGLELARSAGATHFLSLDTDEFYRPYELANAKTIVQECGWKSTSVCSFFHLLRPVFRARDTTCCCFITRIDEDTQIGVADFPCANVDSTRRMTAKTETHHHFDVDVVAMYHMNFVRTDLPQKLRNSSTVNRKFLRQVELALEAWTPTSDFIFPSKGVFKVFEACNEFNTYDPGPVSKASKSSWWRRWVGLDAPTPRGER